MTQFVQAIETKSQLSKEAEHWAKQLLADGYIIIPEIVKPSLVNLIEADLTLRFEKTPYCKGDFYGEHTKRFGSLLSRSPHAQKFIQHHLIEQIVNYILKPFCDSVQLNLTQALEIHPGAPVQVPHRDQDMWGGQKGDLEYLVNVMWPFTEYTECNGATLIWPNSHRCQDDMLLPAEDAINAEMKPGSALLFLGSTLHGAGQNTTEHIRRGMIISYCLGWLKPYENQWLAYPPEVARQFSPELAALVGYCQHRPNLGNYEGQCPSVLLTDRQTEYLHAVDELKPDQQQLINQFYEGDLPLAA